MRFASGLFLLINLMAIAVSNAADSAHALSAMRKTFLQAEQYIQSDRDDDYFTLADTLKSYSLYPYLHYQWLSKHLDEEIAVRAFLHDYPNTRYASLLHGKWLAHLGKKQQWLPFIQYYRGSNSVELQCYFSQAENLYGQQQAALQKAKQLWLSGKSQPEACDKLFDWLKASPDFGPELVWQRFENALRQNNSQLARQQLPLMPEAERNIAETWLKLHERPQLVKEPATWKSNYPKAGSLFVHAIVRWGENAPQAAVKLWDSQKHQYNIPAELAADTEKRLAMGLAYRRDIRACSRLAQFAGNDQSAQEWRIRAALSQQNWHEVLLALDALSDDLKAEDKWQYWRARALNQTNRNLEAQTILQALAKQRSFYGFMAADLLKQEIMLNHQPVAVSEREVDQLQHNNEFQAANELLAIGRKAEAARQWWHAIAELDNHQLTVAAKLAQQWQWPSVAISTIAKAKHWDDMDLRFPLSYSTQVQEHANAQQLDPALIFALIRQESAFDEMAGSSAGAIGLMQLMPKTAQQLAGEFKENWTNDFNLLTPAVNIKYGSYYFKKALNRFDGHYALAIAAYNAGGNRVKQWLPQNKALPADIWIETVPFKETRGYISSVMMYALIYQQRLHRSGLKIPDLMKEVRPS